MLKPYTVEFDHTLSVPAVSKNLTSSAHATPLLQLFRDPSKTTIDDDISDDYNDDDDDNNIDSLSFNDFDSDDRSLFIYESRPRIIAFNQTPFSLLCFSHSKNRPFFN